MDPNYEAALANARLERMAREKDEQAMKMRAVPRPPSAFDTLTKAVEAGDVNETRQILSQRGNVHGKFEHNAICLTEFQQTFQKVFIASGKKTLIPEVSIGLMMVLHKIGRIASGDSYELDHYKDIMGYTQLMIDAIRKKNNQEEFLGTANGAANDSKF